MLFFSCPVAPFGNFQNNNIILPVKRQALNACKNRLHERTTLHILARVPGSTLMRRSDHHA
jgi:hypothetical protein